MAIKKMRLDELTSEELKSNKFSILVPKLIRFHYAQGRDLVCHKCGREILEGSWYRRKMNGGKVRKFYHLSCWRDLFLEL